MQTENPARRPVCMWIRYDCVAYVMHTISFYAVILYKYRLVVIATALPGSIVIIHNTVLIFPNKRSHRSTEKSNSDLSKKPHLQPLPHEIPAVAVRVPWVQAGVGREQSQPHLPFTWCHAPLAGQTRCHVYPRRGRGGKDFRASAQELLWELNTSGGTRRVTD